METLGTLYSSYYMSFQQHPMLTHDVRLPASWTLQKHDKLYKVLSLSCWPYPPLYRLTYRSGCRQAHTSIRHVIILDPPTSTLKVLEPCVTVTFMYGESQRLSPSTYQGAESIKLLCCKYGQALWSCRCGAQSMGATRIEKEDNQVEFFKHLPVRSASTKSAI